MSILVFQWIVFAMLGCTFYRGYNIFFSSDSSENILIARNLNPLRRRRMGYKIYDCIYI